jgi:hypothetical protein
MIPTPMSLPYAWTLWSAAYPSDLLVIFQHKSVKSVASLTSTMETGHKIPQQSQSYYQATNSSRSECQLNSYVTTSLQSSVAQTPSPVIAPIPCYDDYCLNSDQSSVFVCHKCKLPYYPQTPLQAHYNVCTKCCQLNIYNSLENIDIFNGFFYVCDHHFVKCLHDVTTTCPIPQSRDGFIHCKHLTSAPSNQYHQPQQQSQNSDLSSCVIPSSGSTDHIKDPINGMWFIRSRSPSPEVAKKRTRPSYMSPELFSPESFDGLDFHQTIPTNSQHHVNNILNITDSIVSKAIQSPISPLTSPSTSSQTSITSSLLVNDSQTSVVPACYSFPNHSFEMNAMALHIWHTNRFEIHLHNLIRDIILPKIDFYYFGAYSIANWDVTLIKYDGLQMQARYIVQQLNSFVKNCGIQLSITLNNCTLTIEKINS